MVFDYENLLVNGVLFEFELEGILDFGDLREILEILDEEMRFCLSLKQHAAWVKLCSAC